MSVKRKDNKGRILREGEIQKADGRYEFRYYDVNGVRRSLYSWRLSITDLVPEGKRQCESLRDLEKAVLRDVQDGIQTKSNVTLNSRFDSYISDKKELRGSTRANYRYLYNKYIRSAIGNKKLSELNFSVLKRFFNGFLYDKGLKPRTILAIYAVVHPVFDVAVRDNYIRKNPLDGVIDELKKSNLWVIKKKHGLTEKQQQAFMEYVRTSDIFNHWYLLFACMFGTGCRIGELLGLRWNDVDWNENVIRIDSSLNYRLQENGKVEFDEAPPKTDAGIREIPMFLSVRKLLMEERSRRPGDGFIFVNRYGKPLTSYDINRAIERILERYKADGGTVEIPKFTSHQLRHTFCTKLCQNETDLKLIQEIMGHSDISITMNVYNESNAERKKASFSRIESTTDFTTGRRRVM